MNDRLTMSSGRPANNVHLAIDTTFIYRRQWGYAIASVSDEDSSLARISDLCCSILSTSFWVIPFQTFEDVVSRYLSSNGKCSVLPFV